MQVATEPMRVDYVKRGQTYVFRFVESTRDAALQYVTHLTASHTTPLRWADAARINRAIREAEPTDLRVVIFNPMETTTSKGRG